MKKIEILQKLKEILNLPNIEFKLLLDIVVRYFSSKLKDQEYIYIEQVGYFKLKKYTNQFINEDEAIFAVNFSLENPEKSAEELNLGTLRLHIPTKDSIDNLFELGINKPVISDNLRSETEIFDEIAKYDLRKAVEFKLEKYLNKKDSEYFEDDEQEDDEIEDEFIFGKEVLDDDEIISPKKIKEKPVETIGEEPLKSNSLFPSQNKISESLSEFDTEEDDDSEFLFGKNPDEKPTPLQDSKKKFSFNKRITNINEDEDEQDDDFTFNKHFSRITPEQLKESDSSEQFTDYNSLKTTKDILPDDEQEELEQENAGIEILDFNEIIKKKKSSIKKLEEEEAEEEPEEDVIEDEINENDEIKLKVTEVQNLKGQALPVGDKENQAEQKPDVETSKIKKVKNESRIWLILSLLFIVVISILIYLRFFGLPSFLKSENRIESAEKQRVNPVIIQRDFSIPVNYPYSPTKRLNWEKEMLAEIIQDSLTQSAQSNTIDDFSPFGPQRNESPQKLENKVDVQETKKPKTESLVIEKSVLSSKMISDHIVQEGNNYLVQTSSWKQKAQAEREVARLKKLGFDSYISESTIKGRGNWFRVRIGKFDTIEKAQQMLAKVKPHI